MPERPEGAAQRGDENPKAPRSSVGIISLTAWTLAVLLMVEVLILTRENMALKRSRGAPQTVSAGAIIRSVVGVATDGRYTSIALPGPNDRPLLIMTFGPRCGPCDAGAQEAAWVASQASANGWGVVWVSNGRLGDTQAFAREENLSVGRVIAEVPERVYMQLGLGFVPQVLAVRSGGVVEHVWTGEITPARAASVLGFVRAARYGDARSMNSKKGE